MKTQIAAIAIGLTLLLTANKGMAAPLTLYDGSSGVTPNQFNSPSPWFIFGSPNGGTQSASGGVTTLDTNLNNSIYAGYSNYNVANPPTNPLSVITPTTLVNPLFPTLDRNAGYRLTFTVKINSQTNDGTNGAFRAGFSVLALSSDKQGIEIGFRNTDIFSQNNSSFQTIGEQVNDVGSLLSNLTTYNLNVAGDSYTLKSGEQILLTGLLRNYQGASGFGSDVYGTSNFIFLGDNTTSARASIDLANVSLTTNTAEVPFETSETISIGVLAVAGGLNYWRRKNKLKK
ncbi:PEP-CTERM sorting domain-containing protein [Anabaena sp. CCY 0017]|uniref:choice-of-anchor Y domain-containing protein n=1 Tax=Anabaena sp. CCY 0017 TaxID=3103866 RepID=UPI0039C72F18